MIHFNKYLMIENIIYYNQYKINTRNRKKPPLVEKVKYQDLYKQVETVYIKINMRDYIMRVLQEEKKKILFKT